MYAPRVEGEPQSAKIRNALKSFASRSWNRPGRDRPDVLEAIRYVVAEHGEDMAVFVGGVSDAERSLLRSHLSKHPNSCRAPGAHCLRLTVQSCPLPDKPPQPSLSFAKNLLTTGKMDEPRYKAAWRKADQPLTLDQLF